MIRFINKQMQIIIILVCVSFLSNQRIHASYDFRVTTLNMLYQAPYVSFLRKNAPKSTAISFENRMKGFALFVDQRPADIICLQEFPLDGSPEAKLATNAFARNGYSHLEEDIFAQSRGRYGLAIVYNTQFTRRSSEGKSFAVTPSNGFLYTLLQHNKSGNTVGVLTCHLPWGKAPQALQEIATFMAAQPRPDAFILCGDFNDGRATEFVPAAFGSVLSNSNPDNNRTHRDADDSHVCYDYLFYQGLAQVGAVNIYPRVLDLLISHHRQQYATTPGMFFSDHAAVTQAFNFVKTSRPTSESRSRSGESSSWSGAVATTASHPVISAPATPPAIPSAGLRNIRSDFLTASEWPSAYWLAVPAGGHVLVYVRDGVNAPQLDPATGEANFDYYNPFDNQYLPYGLYFWYADLNQTVDGALNHIPHALGRVRSMNVGLDRASHVFRPSPQTTLYFARAYDGRYVKIDYSGPTAEFKGRLRQTHPFDLRTVHFEPETKAPVFTRAASLKEEAKAAWMSDRVLLEQCTTKSAEGGLRYAYTIDSNREFVFGPTDIKKSDTGVTVTVEENGGDNLIIRAFYAGAQRRVLDNGRTVIGSITTVNGVVYEICSASDSTGNVMELWSGGRALDIHQEELPKANLSLWVALFNYVYEVGV